MSGKNIIGITKDGSYKKLSLQEIRVKKLNSWKGWHCSVGQLNISIDENGNMKGGDCGVGGFLGNLYTDDIKLSEKWHICTKNYCSCMFDIPVVKVKDKKYLNIINNKKEASNEEFVHFSGINNSLRFEWFISSKCNYNCSYCPTNYHNKNPHKNSYENIINGVDKLNNLNIKYNVSFWGGEPTLFPKYIDICNKITEKGNSVYTVTNGSRSSSYLKDLINYSSLNISLHEEFLDIKKITNNIIHIIEEIENKKLTNWIMLRCMVKPGSLSYWYNFLKNLKEEIPDFDKKIKVTLNTLLYLTEDNCDLTDNLINYSDNEIEILTKFGRLTGL